MSKNGYNLDTMYSRYLAQEIASNHYSCLLLGPRQTGKSTLLHQMKPDLEINFADEATFLEFSSNPARLEEVLSPGNIKTVFIDEVQRLPNLLNTIQKIIDQTRRAPRRKLRFFLSGSSARKLRRGQANLLPGRILSYFLGPLHLLETGGDVSIDALLSYGALPGVVTEPQEKMKKALLTSYAGTYLKEEIQAEALTKNIEGFSRFLFVMAAKNGQFVDFSKLGSQASINQKTASRFFEIMEDTLVVKRLPAFSGSDLKRLVQHPKFYFFDVGVLNGLLNNFRPSLDRIGMLFENLVFSQITSLLDSLAQTYRISTYRTNKNAEVDFILELENQMFAIEVKASKNIGEEDFRGLKSFRLFQPQAKPWIIYLGTREFEKNDVLVLPLRSALERLKKRFD
jgi:predicted AAA+ superfamily ATPase